MNHSLEVDANRKEVRNACKSFVKLPEGKIRLGKSNFGKKNIMEAVIRKCDKQVWTGFMLLIIGLRVGLS